MGIHIGTSGYFYNDWNYRFYPKGLKNKLTFYSNFFDTVEINNTHYKYPTKVILNKWIESIPNNFIFSFKAPKFITHAYALLSRDEILEKFFEPLEIIPKDKYLILFQLPETSPLQLINLKNLIDKLPSNFKYAFEFRNESWFCDQTYKTLKERNIAIVISDSPKINMKYKWPYHDIETANFTYIRFHGPKELYASKYSEDELLKYLDFISDKKSRGQDIYVYFNNDINGYAIENAKFLKNYLKIK